jgi:hypothetical protein
VLINSFGPTISRIALIYPNYPLTKSRCLRFASVRVDSRLTKLVLAVGLLPKVFLRVTSVQQGSWNLVLSRKFSPLLSHPLLWVLQGLFLPLCSSVSFVVKRFLVVAPLRCVSVVKLALFQLFLPSRKIYFPALQAPVSPIP